MREAIGGSILFYIILGFLAVYIVFIGVIMNYAATYRASNYVLTRIEQTEANIEVGLPSDTADKDTLYGVLKSRNYNNALNVCCYDVGQTDNSIYKITTYVNFEVPLLGLDMKLNVKNDTKTIYGVRCSDREKQGYLRCN